MGNFMVGDDYPSKLFIGNKAINKVMKGYEQCWPRVIPHQTVYIRFEAERVDGSSVKEFQVFDLPIDWGDTMTIFIDVYPIRIFPTTLGTEDVMVVQFGGNAYENYTDILTSYVHHKETTAFYLKEDMFEKNAISPGYWHITWKMKASTTPAFYAIRGNESGVHWELCDLYDFSGTSNKHIGRFKIYANDPTLTFTAAGKTMEAKFTVSDGNLSINSVKYENKSAIYTAGLNRLLIWG